MKLSIFRKVAKLSFKHSTCSSGLSRVKEKFYVKGSREFTKMRFRFKAPIKTWPRGD